MFANSSKNIYFIAEFNTSHFGDVELAKRMIEAAKASGADCVKFQSWTSETLYSKSYYDENPIAKRFVKKYSLSEDELKKLAHYCNDMNIDFLSTPYSIEEARFLVDTCKSGAVKVASMEINNLAYLKEIAELNLPILLSTGMGTLSEIHAAVNVILGNGSAPLCLFHCVSQYPTSVENAQMLNIQMLKDEFPDVVIGYSDHTLGYEAAIASVALGARVIERHFTLDKTKIGMDNNMASEPHEFKALVEHCQNVSLSLGSYDRVLTNEDFTQRLNMRRSIVYKSHLSSGHVISIDDIAYKRPGSGMPPTDSNKVIGRQLMKDVAADTLVETSDWEV